MRALYAQRGFAIAKKYRESRAKVACHPKRAATRSRRVVDGARLELATSALRTPRSPN
jgi:hypothetical protein